MTQYKDIFQITHNDLLPAKGSVLISEPFMQDAYFQRSVVLLIEHNENGSMGFVLNKKLDLVVNDFFSDFEDFPKMSIYLGGPVRSDRLFFIHTLGDLIIPNAEKISENVYFDGEFDALKRYIMHGHSIEGKVKFFLGYSGWTQDQLANEIERNSWVVSHVYESLFKADGEEFWKNSIISLGGKYKTWINYPKDPYCN
ncbi:YqgE/AlgH family protein [Parabacteroides pacaensis]|uniref:YqgE/AlgH family protein n=1 Tax=Parabacteroides pacaensis TaxID=2086575 RepID=UPI000D106899|nr:YqgE/AlgH family protein [Parabacteroides pacaensis]